MCGAAEQCLTTRGDAAESFKNFLGHASNSGRPDRDVALISGAFQNFAFPVEITAQRLCMSNVEKTTGLALL